MNLEVAGADRHLEPVTVATRLLKRLRDLRLAGAEEAKRAPQRRRSAVEHRAHGVDLERVRPEPLQLARRSRQDDHRRSVRVDDEPGRGAGQAEARRARGDASPASAHPPRSRRTAASAALRLRARSLRSGLPARRRRTARARRPWPRSRPCDRRASGPSPPEHATRSAEASASRSAASSSPGSSPTISIRAGSSPRASRERARKGPFRSGRSPRTSSLPVTTITARGRPAPGLNWRRRRRSSSPSRRRPAP